jgi:hypothetical protein
MMKGPIQIRGAYNWRAAFLQHTFGPEGQPENVDGYGQFDAKGVPRASAEDHTGVADAIMAGDATGASREMYMLIEGALNLLLSREGPPMPRRATRSRIM